MLYGKLKGRPDLQRDLFAALLGAGVGSAAYLAKQADQEKEAIAWAALPAFGKFLGTTAIGTAAWVALDRAVSKKERAQTAQHQTDTLARVKDLEEREKVHAMSRYVGDYNRRRGQEMAAKGIAGGALGGGGGWALSRLYSRLKGTKPNMRQDILAALVGTGTGAALGLHQATKDQPAVQLNVAAPEQSV